MAELHPQLQKDCLLIGRFTLCRLLLMRDANYPWFILVPDREGIAEIFELSEADQVQLLRESSRLAAILSEHFHADKLNIAALGNVVPQLHLHHIVRYRDDAAWPAPVWGRVPPRNYTPEELSSVLARLRSGLRGNFEYF
jgi:diadenosine tetraphosphate (Ap4A) HIT family hydrolase